jgi:hypothetical protein
MAGGSSPDLWTDANYALLRRSIERGVPEDERRNEALTRVSNLDCTRTGDSLASCDPSVTPPDAVQQWKKTLEGAIVDHNAYAKALASILGDLVCSGDPDVIYVLRGLLHNQRFQNTGAETPALAKRITSAECPVSAALTDADKRVIAALKRTESP